MNSISKYIFRQAAVVTIFVTAVLCFVIWLTQSLRFVDLIVNRGLPVTEFLWLAMLMLPRFLSLILPIACFIGVVFVYNKMIGDRELVVLRAAGFSNLRLVRPAILLALLVSSAIYALNIYVLPASERQFSDLRYAVKSDYSTILLQEGVFHTLPNRITIFIRRRRGAGQLDGILVHDAHDRERPVTLMAEQGALVQTPAGPRVILLNGLRQEIDRKDGKLSILSFEKYTVDLSVAGRRSSSSRKRNPQEMFLWELFDPSLQGGKTAQFMAEGHSRLSSPLLPLTFVFVSLAFLLSGDFSRRGQADRVLASVAAIVIIYVLAIGIRNLSNDEPAAIPFMYSAAIVPILIGLFILAFPRRRAGRPPPRAEAAADSP